MSACTVVCVKRCKTKGVVGGRRRGCGGVLFSTALLSETQALNHTNVGHASNERGILEI